MVVLEGVPNGGNYGRGVYIQLIPPGAIHAGRVTSPTCNMVGICNVRLQT